jgi:hypothetical protein
MEPARWSITPARASSKTEKASSPFGRVVAVELVELICERPPLDDPRLRLTDPALRADAGRLRQEFEAWLVGAGRSETVGPRQLELQAFVKALAQAEEVSNTSVLLPRDLRRRREDEAAKGADWTLASFNALLVWWQTMRIGRARG